MTAIIKATKDKQTLTLVECQNWISRLSYQGSFLPLQVQINFLIYWLIVYAMTTFMLGHHLVFTGDVWCGHFLCKQGEWTYSETNIKLFVSPRRGLFSTSRSGVLSLQVRLNPPPPRMFLFENLRLNWVDLS